MCDWSDKVAKSDIKEKNIGGYVGGEILELVIEAYLEYHKQNAPVSVDHPDVSSE
jgi:hypothetical protein